MKNIVTSIISRVLRYVVELILLYNGVYLIINKDITIIFAICFFLFLFLLGQLESFLIFKNKLIVYKFFHFKKFEYKDIKIIILSEQPIRLYAVTDIHISIISKNGKKIILN